MLVEKMIDISAVGLLMTDQRRRDLDLCWPTFSENIDLLTTRSGAPKLNVGAYIEIFPVTAWILCLLLLLVGALLFAIASR